MYEESNGNLKVHKKLRPYCVQQAGTSSGQHGLEAGAVYADPTVCSCSHSKCSAWVRSMYCVWRPYLCAAVGTASHPTCVQLQAQQVISICLKHVLCVADLEMWR